MKANFADFQNCLRIQLTPDEYAKERIQGLLVHCKKFGFNNVIFLTAGEEFFLGHATKEEIKPWVDVIKKASAVLRANNIGVSLHHWIGFGHLDRGIGLKPNQNFTTMVDFNGKKSLSVACPLCENWQEHFKTLLSYLVKEIKPDYYWVEDDFRLHNHAPLEWGGCFCEKHIAWFNQILGTHYTREEFCKKAFQVGAPTKERKVWLDVSRQTMLDYATLIREIIKTANPTTEIALMTSFPEEHCLEARDWTGLFDIFSNGVDKLNRIHLPGYFERSGKDYMYDFNAISMAIRALSPKDTKILPELENGSINLFRKNAKYLAFQLESALPLCLAGMTYNIYDPVGNGVVEAFGYAKEVKRLTPYMQAVMDAGVSFSDISGVVVPIDEKIVYEKKISNNFYDLRTNIFNTGAYVSSLGLSYRYSKEKTFLNETVFLFGDAVYLFTDEQLKKLFENNNVVLDGGATLLLKERNLLSLIGAKNAMLYPSESGYQTYEQIATNDVVYGIKGFRASCRIASGDFVKIDYDGEVECLSNVYKADGSIKVNSFVKGKNFLVNPFVVDKKLYTQFSELRRYFISNFVEEKTNIILNSRFEGIYCYLYAKEKEALVMLINSTIENFEKIEFYIKGVDFNKIVCIDKDGTNRNLTFNKVGDLITILEPFDYMSTKTIKLVKE